MRLFLAIPAGEEATAALAPLLARWRIRDWPVRWARPEDLHLTLKFLGAVDAARLETVERAVRDAVEGTAGLSFCLSGVGAFPSMAEARVLWAGLESEPGLELLVHRIERACATLDFPVEGRPFRPHLTLGRLQESRRLSAAAVMEIESEVVTPVAFLAEAVVLYESLAGTGGARYQPRATFSLRCPA